MLLEMVLVSSEVVFSFETLGLIMGLWGLFKLLTDFKAERIVKVVECLVVVFTCSHVPTFPCVLVTQMK